MSTFVYNIFMSGVGASGTDLDWTNSGSTFRLILLSGGVYVPNQVTHRYYSDISGWEYSGGTYSQTGNAVNGRIIATGGGSNNFADYKADNVTFSSLSQIGDGNISSVAILLDRESDGTDCELVCHLSGTDFPVIANGGDLTIQFSGGVVFRVTGG